MRLKPQRDLTLHPSNWQIFQALREILNVEIMYNRNPYSLLLHNVHYVKKLMYKSLELTTLILEKFLLMA